MKLNLPNILTLSRIAVIPLIVLLSYSTFPLKPILLCSLYLLACITDFFDGHIARKSGLTSSFGRMMDPVSDKLLVISVVVVLLADGTLQGVHMIAALLIILREIFVSGLREFLSEVKVIMPPSRLAKWKTAAQMAALAGLLAAPAVAPQYYIHQISLGLLWIAVLITVKTGYDYLGTGLKHFS